MNALAGAAAQGGGSGASGSISNAQILILKKIAESKVRELSQKMLAEYCINMNKEMIKNVSKIVEELDINNQTEIFQEVADQFFDKELSNMYIDELKRTIRLSVKKNLRSILYDHFKADLKVEQEENKKKREAEAEQTGGVDAAGAGPGPRDEVGEEEDSEENGGEEEGSTSSSGSSVAEGSDATYMSREILDKINDRILTDDDFLKEIKTGIISNVTSGSFKSAMQREVFAQLVPKLKTMIENKITYIINTNELKNAAIEVTKEQQSHYNAQNKRGGKKHSIKKSTRPYGKKTRKHHIYSSE